MSDTTQEDGSSQQAVVDLPKAVAQAASALRRIDVSPVEVRITIGPDGPAVETDLPTVLAWAALGKGAPGVDLDPADPRFVQMRAVVGHTTWTLRTGPSRAIPPRPAPRPLVELSTGELATQALNQQ